MLRAELAQHEPAPRRRADRTIVVDDDPVVSADAKPPHRRTEFGRRRQHVRRRIRAIRQFVYVEKHGTGNMRVAKLIGALAPAGRHEPTGVDNPKIRFAEMPGQPFGGNERVHARGIATWARCPQ